MPDVFVESKWPKYTPLKYVLIIGVTFIAMYLQFVSLSPFWGGNVKTLQGKSIKYISLWIR